MTSHLPFTVAPLTIVKVEFYFSTQNLVTDQHLFMEMEGPKNRPVSIKHLHTFKRMRRFQPFSAIVAALEDSNDLIVVKNDEHAGPGNEAVKRKEPLTIPKEDGDEDKDLSIMQLFYRLKNATSNDLDKCVYVKGFGDEEDAGQIALEQFFRPFGSVMVRKRRDDNGAFKGSIFVEFDSKDSQEQFLGLDPKPKFKDSELTVMGKKEYVEMKCKEKGIKPDWELTPEERAAQHKKRREEQGDRRSNQGRDHGRYGPRGKNRGGREHHRRDDRYAHTKVYPSRFRSRSNSYRSRSRSRSRSRTPPRRRHHDRSRSPRRHRHRSVSVDDDDWNTRRDRYRSGKDDRGSRRKDDRRDRKNEIERDAHGVPIVKDTRTEAEIAASKKRKAEEEGRSEETKKSKLEIKEDE